MLNNLIVFVLFLLNTLIRLLPLLIQHQPPYSHRDNILIVAALTIAAAATVNLELRSWQRFMFDYKPAVLFLFFFFIYLLCLLRTPHFAVAVVIFILIGHSFFFF